MSDNSEKWLRLFKNIESIEELDAFFTNVSGKNLQNWELKYLEYENKKEAYIDEQLSVVGWEFYKPQEKLRTDIHWLDLFKPICFKYFSQLDNFLNDVFCIEDKEKFLMEIESIFLKFV